MLVYIDDIQLYRDVVKNIFESKGISAMTFSSPDDFCDALDRKEISLSEITYLVCDYHFPANNLDDIDFVSHIRQTRNYKGYVGILTVMDEVEYDSSLVDNVIPKDMIGEKLFALVVQNSKKPV